MVYTTQQDTVLNVIHTIRLAIWIDNPPIYALYSFFENAIISLLEHPTT